MKPYFCAAAVFSLLPSLAHAQVVVNQAALDQLAGIQPKPVAVVEEVPAPVVHRVVHHVVHKIPPPVTVAVAKPAAPPPVPAVAKPVALKPVAPKLVAPKPAAPPPAVSLHFAGGSSDLPAGAASALQPFCADKTARVVINAAAPGNPSDPSVAMRLSMQRAFAVQAALTACGVPGTNILPRALGSAGGKDLDTTQVTLAP